MLPSQPKEPGHVMATGFADWPVDPFRVSVPPGGCYPACPEGVLRRWHEIPGQAEPVLDEA